MLPPFPKIDELTRDAEPPHLLQRYWFPQSYRAPHPHALRPGRSGVPDRGALQAQLRVPATSIPGRGEDSDGHGAAGTLPEVHGAGEVLPRLCDLLPEGNGGERVGKCFE